MKDNNRGATIISRGLLFSIIWWVLSDGSASSWWIGVPAVLLAVIASIALVPPVRLAWVGFIRFVPFFFMHSLMGGADVAWRAFHPDLPIAPDLIEYPLRLPPGLPQVFMANTVSLLPGTLSAELDRGVLQVHVLDRRKDFLAGLEAVEQSVARVFGVSLNVADRGK
ncbi:MAG: Na+/H+ antiporter subunit E [Pseudomonadota bacterium]